MLAPAVEIIRIDGSDRLFGGTLRELWNNRELVYFLAWRDVKVRYKQTAVGALWAILQPLLTMLVFSLFFGRLAKVPSDGIPYPLFSLAGLAPWTFFSYGLSQASNSLVTNANMLKKIYFPRLAMPLSTVVSGLVDLGCALAVLFGMMALYRVHPDERILWLPAFLLLAFMTALGVGLWLAVLNVSYRDVRYIVPFLIQFWMYATPIAYPSSLLHQPWRALFGLNPMAGVVEGFRWALLGSNTGPGPMIAVSSTASMVVLITGVLFFRRMEKTFADVA